ncbi:MAG: redox-sensitive bicupin YhaK (pirin superfamily) [Candidatus Woesearchaeota archaeon]|jgi:redox-sensitive bicupin YhaK (pirin superfamily)
MNIKLHKSDERGRANIDWLQSRFSFSFSDYYDPTKMGFGALRVLNDDIISAGQGFGMHPHQNMEIISIVLDGALEHKDSIGSGGVIKPGEIQVMSAGSGITHSEFNHSQEKSVSLLQLWIQTKEQNITPRYEQKMFDFKQNTLVPVASGIDKTALYIHQDATISVGNFDADNKQTISLDKNQGVYIFVISGELSVDENILAKRDAIAVSGCDQVTFKTTKASHVLCIVVPL